MSPEIIVYSYEFAPNPQKLFHFLALFKIPFKYVVVPDVMPRPMLADIGITYRRTPLLSIGSDVYIDNALIIGKLSDIAQHSDCGLEDATNHLEFDGLGQLAFQYATRIIPADMPIVNDPAFLADRSELLGREFSPKIFPMIRPQSISSMISLVRLVERHYLQDESKDFILPGKTPSTADIHLYWGLNWGLRFHTGARPEISEETNPKIFKWLSAVGSFLEGRRIETKISMDDAYKVLQVPPTHEYAKFVPHVKDNQEGLQPGQKIKVTPVDSGTNHPQFGELLSLNYEQVCLRNEKGVVMHFPRFGYDVVAA